MFKFLQHLSFHLRECRMHFSSKILIKKMKHLDINPTPSDHATCDINLMWIWYQFISKSSNQHQIDINLLCRRIWFIGGGTSNFILIGRNKGVGHLSTFMWESTSLYFLVCKIIWNILMWSSTKTTGWWRKEVISHLLPRVKSLLQEVLYVCIFFLFMNTTGVKMFSLFVCFIFT